MLSVCVSVCVCVLLQLCRHRKILNYIICSLKYRSGKYYDRCYIITARSCIDMLHNRKVGQGGRRERKVRLQEETHTEIKKYFTIE